MTSARHHGVFHGGHTAGSLCIGIATIALLACDRGANARDVPLTAHDSTATAIEARASLQGELPGGAQSYSYRGLSTGLSRQQLELRVHATRPAGSAACHQGEKHVTEVECSYVGSLGADDAPVRVDVVYAGATPREITVVRDLPLDVDGVELARSLSDAFERQTSLLDRRDASYGHHQAQIRMGTVGGARSNYADVTVMPHLGREQLTVKLTRAELTAPSLRQSPDSHAAKAKR